MDEKKSENAMNHSRNSCLTRIKQMKSNKITDKISNIPAQDYLEQRQTSAKNNTCPMKKYIGMCQRLLTFATSWQRLEIGFLLPSQQSFRISCPLHKLVAIQI